MRIEFRRKETPTILFKKTNKLKRLRGPIKISQTDTRKHAVKFKING